MHTALLATLMLCLGCKKQEVVKLKKPDTADVSKTPEFTLTNQSGKEFSSSQLQGKPWVVHFVFTACPTICPEVTKNVAAVHGAVDTDKAHFVTITVDPENDTPSKLLSYAQKQGAAHENWQFLTGERDVIWQLSKESFKLPVAEGGDSKHGVISHSSKVLLFQKDGSLGSVYEGTSEDDMGKLKNDLQELIASGTGNEDGYTARIVVPDEIEKTKVWMKSRGADQIASKGKIDAPVDFKFSDQQEQSGIDFRHYIVDCAGKNYKAAHYDHGNGIAVADVDGDDLLDVYFVSQVGSSRLYKNLGNGKFKDITEKAGVAVEDTISVTASFADIDNDGDPDLYVTNVRNANQLFINDGDGRFKDASKGSGIDYNEHSSAAVFFDYNNDGLLDLFLCVVGEYTTNELAKVEGTVSADDVKKSFPKYYVALRDAFAGHLKPERERSSKLFQNTGQGTFKDVTEATGLIDKGWSGAAIPVDFNRDGYQDLYVLSMQGRDGYWENQAGKKFINKSRELFPTTPWGAMDVKSFDYNNDGHMDLYITDMHSDMSFIVGPSEEKDKAMWVIDKWGEDFLNDGGRRILGNAFFQNNGEDSFREKSDNLNMENFWPWGLSVGDLNADGWQDAFVCASMNYPFRYGINTALINNRGKGFKDAEFILGIEPRKDGELTLPWFELDASGADRDHKHAKGHDGKILVVGTKGTRSSAIFDLDGDGDLDIITNEFGDVPQVLISDLAGGERKVNFIKIKLKGTKSNRDGLGARVKVTSGSLIQTQVHDGQSGYLSQSSMPLYFGLGEMKKIDAIEVSWPSGAITKLTQDLKFNGVLEITEPPQPE
ncbi:MAG: FG-GAP-like repeat-containing protein [Akkermansiaceae bacterium]